MKSVERNFRLFLASTILAGTMAGCKPGPSESPDVSVSPTPITSPVPDHLVTPTYESTATQEATAIPTERPTMMPTENPYEIDMEKFYNHPENYEYLLAHPDEFVQAPDAITDRVAFDRWWNEEFLPALGEPLERDVDIRVDGMGPSRDGGFETSALGDSTLISQPGFFYFETNGEVFPVPVIDVSMRNDGPYVNFTMAIILFDYNNANDKSIETSLSLLQEGKQLFSIKIRGGDFPGDYSEAVREFNRNNRVVIDWLNRVAFGFGYIKP